MSLSQSVATALTELGLARQEVQNIAQVAQAQITAVGSAFQNRIAGLQTTSYIDQLNGLDTNPGTDAAPYKTLNKALEMTPFGGYCMCLLKGPYTLAFNLPVIGKMLHVKSSSVVRHDFNFERIGSATHRWPACFYFSRGGAAKIEELSVIMPNIAGYEGLALAGNPGGLFSASIDGWSQVNITLANINLYLPETPYAPVIQGGMTVNLNWYAVTLTGPLTSHLGRVLATQTNTAGVATNTIPELHTNLATI